MHDFMYSRQGAQYAVEELLYQHDFVAPEQMAAGALGAPAGACPRPVFDGQDVA